MCSRKLRAQSSRDDDDEGAGNLDPKRRNGRRPAEARGLPAGFSFARRQIWDDILKNSAVTARSSIRSPPAVPWRRH